MHKIKNFQNLQFIINIQFKKEIGINKLHIFNLTHLLKYHQMNIIYYVAKQFKINYLIK